MSPGGVETSDNNNKTTSLTAVTHAEGTSAPLMHLCMYVCMPANVCMHLMHILPARARYFLPNLLCIQDAMVANHKLGIPGFYCCNWCQCLLPLTHRPAVPRSEDREVVLCTYLDTCRYVDIYLGGTR